MLRVLTAKANLFCNKRRNSPAYGVTTAKFYPIKSQYSCNLQQPDLLQNRFDVGGKMRNIDFPLVWQQCCKRSCTFLLPGRFKYTLVLCDLKYFHLHQLCASMSVCHLYINGNQTGYYNQEVNFPSADCIKFTLAKGR